MYTDDPVETYLRLVHEVPSMTREREMECVRHVCAGDEHADLAAKDLLEASLAMVVAIAQRHLCEHVHILDLIQTGNSALFEAIQRLPDIDDEDFAAFASPFIEKVIAHQVTTAGL